VAYATVDELAAALRITVTAQNTPTLQACLDAAGEEIDHAVDWVTAPAHPIELPPDPLLNRVNILRGVEWFKSNDAAFGVIGFADTGALQAPKNTFARHAASLIVVKEQYGVA
jgi:hypothetical protein